MIFFLYSYPPLLRPDELNRMRALTADCQTSGLASVFIFFPHPVVTYDSGTSAASEGYHLLGWHTLSSPQSLTYIRFHCLTYFLRVQMCVPQTKAAPYGVFPLVPSGPKGAFRSASRFNLVKGYANASAFATVIPALARLYIQVHCRRLVYGAVFHTHIDYYDMSDDSADCSLILGTYVQLIRFGKCRWRPPLSTGLAIIALCCHLEEGISS